MNRELKDKKYQIPRNVLDYIKKNNTVDGTKRGHRLIDDGFVTYGQLKRILHDMKNIDRDTEKMKYDQYGGDLMWSWGNSVLNNDRIQIKNRKEQQKKANEIGDINGDRQPSYMKKHTKNSTFSPPTNLVKSNSSKFSFASMFSPKSMRLFEGEITEEITEEINRIKKLMI